MTHLRLELITKIGRRSWAIYWKPIPIQTGERIYFIFFCRRKLHLRWLESCFLGFFYFRFYYTSCHAHKVRRRETVHWPLELEDTSPVSLSGLGDGIFGLQNTLAQSIYILRRCTEKISVNDPNLLWLMLKIANTIFLLLVTRHLTQLDTFPYLLKNFYASFFCFLRFLLNNSK